MVIALQNRHPKGTPQPIHVCAILRRVCQYQESLQQKVSQRLAQIDPHVSSHLLLYGREAFCLYSFLCKYKARPHVFPAGGRIPQSGSEVIDRDWSRDDGNLETSEAAPALGNGTLAMSLVSD